MTTMSDTPLGRIEIAELLDVDARTPHAWMARGLLPAPDYPRVNGSPAWKRSTIIAWAAHVGRLPKELFEEATALGIDTFEFGQRGGRVAKREFGLGSDA